jgi:uroporphyrinogen decarboxylase
MIKSDFGDAKLTRFNRAVLTAPQRLAMPIAVYPALSLTGAKVSDIVTDPEAQCEAQKVLHERYGTPFVLSAMDLSVEAEAFGCEILMSDTEIPTVTGRLVTSLEEAQRLPTPKPGDGRTGLYLEVVQRLGALHGHPLVLGGCIGPFSLAARLTGVSEAMELTMTEPELMHTLLEKSATFLTAYVRAFKDAGAAAVVMAEPAAGLLSPRGMAAFSSAYVRRISEAVSDGEFSIVLHNCGAKLLHLPAMLETGLSAFHFGAPMDVPGALLKVPATTVVCGNLDPSAVFCRIPAAEARARAAALLAAAAGRRNFVLSSGCDIPPNAQLANLDAFYEALGRGQLPRPALVENAERALAAGV